MAETSQASPAQSPSNEQLNAVSHPNTKIKKRLPFQIFVDAFKANKTSNDEDHELYKTYGRWAEGVKITAQMCIGIILGITLFIQVIAYVCSFYNIWGESNFQISYVTQSTRYNCLRIIFFHRY